jgi:Flp pilus assembly protein TadG
MNGRAMRDRLMNRGDPRSGVLTSSTVNGASAVKPRRLRARRGGEDGTVTAFVVVFTAALILMAGLVLDGGLTLAAKVQAINDAQAAARAGAQAIDLSTFRTTGQITLDPAEATTDADNYLAAAGHTGTVAVDGDQVTVTVSITQPMQILSIVGIRHLTVTGTGTATAEQNGGAG